MGCDSSGFFSLFNGQSAQCGPVNNQIQQMRGNLDQITTSLERLRSGGIGGADRENQRRSVLTALAQNNCGPQYAAAARGPRQFPRQSVRQQQQSPPPPSADLGAAVRHLPHRLRPHLRRRLFPDLVRHRTGPVSGRRADLQGAVPGDGGDAVHLSQSRRGHEPGGVDQRPALFVVAERVPLPPGVQPVLRLQGGRPDLVGSAEDASTTGPRVEQGDIIVTEESAKKMAQPPPPKPTPAAKRGAAAPTTAEAPAATSAPTPAPAAANGDKPIRSVGPTFLPKAQ